jgi:hypothetical protein
MRRAATEAQTHGGPPSVRATTKVVAKASGWDNMRWGDFRWDTTQVRSSPLVARRPGQSKGFLIARWPSSRGDGDTRNSLTRVAVRPKGFLIYRRADKRLEAPSLGEA